MKLHSDNPSDIVRTAIRHWKWVGIAIVAGVFIANIGILIGQREEYGYTFCRYLFLTGIDGWPQASGSHCPLFRRGG